jgi:acetyl esterase
MQKNAASVGGDGARIAVGGDSAGGYIAAALPLKARDGGLPAPQAAELLAPLTDFFFEQYEKYEQLDPHGQDYDTAFIGFIRGRLSRPRQELGASARQPDACRSARISRHVHRHRYG